MELAFGDEDLAFREEVRAFIRDNLTIEIAESVSRGRALTKQDIQRWQRIL